MLTFPELESHGGRLEAFDDGHCPETFRFQEETNVGDNSTYPSRIMRYDYRPPPTTSSSSSSAPSQLHSLPSDVHVYDGVLHSNSVRMLHDVTASGPLADCYRSGTCEGLEGESPWGTYVTVKEAMEWIEWNRREGGNSELINHDNFGKYVAEWKLRMARFNEWQNGTARCEERNDDQAESEHGKEIFLHKWPDYMESIRHLLAVEAVAKFLIQTASHGPGTAAVASKKYGARSSNANEALFCTAQILSQAHGVAVWALSSFPGHSVQYHIDYAELLRYEYNVTVPPLWAGTLQCSALWNDRKTSSCDNADAPYPGVCDDEHIMRGGEFCVNLGGLTHYRRHGYKGNLSGDPMGGWRRPDGPNQDPARVIVIADHQDDWVTIPYAFNRGIVHRGDLPHLSAPIECIGAYKNGDQDEKGLSGPRKLCRVIVGFNVFGHDVGARVSMAPEHSRPFRRRVRMYRSAIGTFSTKAREGVGAGMDLSCIRKNKGLTKLLVLAKRERVKEEFRRNQEKLSQEIWMRMFKWQHEGGPLLQVTDIVKEFGRPNDSVDGAWPKSVDVQVHLHHMLFAKNRRNPSGPNSVQHQRSLVSNLFHDIDGIAGSSGTFYCLRAVHNKGATCGSESNAGRDNESSGLITLSTQLRLCVHE